MVRPTLGHVDGLVVAAIAPVGIAAGHRLQEGVVQRGIEHHAVVVRGAVDAYHAEFLAPCGLRLRAHGIERKQLARVLAFGIEVAPRAVGIHMRDRTGRSHAARAGQVEAQPRTVGHIPLRAHAVAATRNTALAIPGTEGLERPVEFDAEPRGVLLAAAEAPGDQLAFHRAIADDVDYAADHFVLLVGLADVDQHVAGLFTGSEGVALRRGAGQRRGFDLDAVVVRQPDLVVASLANLARVRVGRGIRLVVEGLCLRVACVESAARADAAGHGQGRDQSALLPATRAGHERMTEASDPRVVIAIAGVVPADRADLDHPERGGCTGEGVALLLGADEGVHL